MPDGCSGAVLQAVKKSNEDDSKIKKSICICFNMGNPAYMIEAALYSVHCL